VEYRPSCCMSRVTYLTNPQGSRYIQDNVLPRGDGTYTAYHDHLRPVVVVRYLPNPQVKDALEAITKQSFHYNRGAWQRWWKSEQLAENSKER